MNERKTYSREFKHEAASLVLDQDLSVQAVCESMDVGPTALRRWVEQVRKERAGQTPVGAKAITADQRRIQELEAKIKRMEREAEILKKATALLMSDSTGRYS